MSERFMIVGTDENLLSRINLTKVLMQDTAGLILDAEEVVRQEQAKVQAHWDERDRLYKLFNDLTQEAEVRKLPGFSVDNLNPDL